RCFLEDITGDLWIGTFGSGIARYSCQTDTFTHFLEDFTAEVNLSRYRINAIQQDKNGHLWIAVYGLGCVVFDPVSGKVVHMLVNDRDLPDDRILSITFDPINPEWVWFSTASGLIRYTIESGEIQHYTVKDGLPNNMVYGALPDETGILWLSTNKGLSRFDPTMETFTNYDANDGLQSNEFNWGAHYRSENGEMFFGGINGMNAFFPDQLATVTNAPPIVITSITVFDVELPGIHPPFYKPLKLSYRDNFFSIEFAALDFTNPAKNQYAYQLEGSDTRWNPNGARNYVSYTNLPPGNYVFRVIGCNADGVWNHTGVGIPIIIIPPFYKTPLFYLIVVALLIFTGFLLYRWRLQQHVKRSVEIERIREKARERVRQAVATDFHDELGQDMTRISLFCEIVKRNLTDVEPEILTYIEKISQAAHHLSSTTRDFIWTLDPEFDSLYEFAIHLRDYGEDFYDGTGIAFYMASFDEAWHHLSLPMKWRRHLTLIFKEAMNNALKHAKCDSVTMSLGVQERAISIALADNGKGEKKKEFSSGNGFGLKNMQRRADSIGGKLTISNAEQGGWRVL
ncbi:hypothetical protein KAH55_06610, partial [bacterium]|nr:hypothetical protein [bacterium]